MNKTSYLILIFLFNLFTINEVIGQESDLIKTTDAIVQDDTLKTPTLELKTDFQKFEGTDDFSPGLLFLTLIGFAFILIFVGVGIVLTILAILIIFGLISVGVLSASLIVGLNKKSFTKGFKTFLVSSITIGGLLIGIIGFLILNKVMHWWSIEMTLLIGSLSGLVSGLIFGSLAFIIIRKLTTLIKNKIKKTTTSYV